MGYRDPLTSGPVHALVLGDSFIFGTGSEHEQTFCEQLRRRTGRPFVNLAIGSYGPAHHVQVLNRDTDRFDAKLALVMLSLNDVEDCGRFQDWHDRRRARGAAGAETVDAPVAHRRSWNRRALDYVLNRVRATLTYRLVKWNLNPDKVNECFKTSLRHHDGALDLEFNESILSWADPHQGGSPRNWELFGKAVTEIKAWSVRRGIPVAVVMVPSKEEVYRDARLRAGGSARFDEAFAAMRRRMGDVCEEEGFDFFDLTEPMREHVERTREQVYLCWDGHWNPRGHELAAELTLDFLTRRGLAPASR
jgi:hypothetical protein